MTRNTSGWESPDPQRGGGLDFYGVNAPDDTIRVRIVGDAFPRVVISPGGDVQFGDGTAAPVSLVPDGADVQPWIPQIVVNDGTATTNPTSGTNPTLGASSFTFGTYWQIGKWVQGAFIHRFGGSGMDPGVGSAYRLTLPLPITSLWNTQGGVVGSGHIFNPAIEPVFQLGPGCFRSVTLHTSTAIGTTTAGIVCDQNLPYTPVANIGSYALTNHANSRTLNESAPTTTQLANVLGTVINDLKALVANSNNDNVGPSVPWTWGQNCAVIGTIGYFTT